VSAAGEAPIVYDKVHLAELGASAERAYFSPGSRLGIFNVAGVRVAMIICYDFRFSGLLNQITNNHEIDLILHPVAFSKDATFPSWHHFAISRALEHQVYFLSLNRAGDNWGNSLFCPPWLDDMHSVTSFDETEQCLRLHINLEVLQHVRKSYPIRADRMSDYSILD